MFNQETAIGLLQQGNTGDEILSILDVIAEDYESNKTLNEIADVVFDWYSKLTYDCSVYVTV